MPEKVPVKVDDRTLTLTNLTKVLYPESGVTKAEVIDYYTRIAPVLLPHLADRPLTVRRFPNGVDAPSFFEKNAPGHRPPWVRTATLPVPGSTMDRETIDFVLVEEQATLVWLGNQAALELHVPQWKVGSKDEAYDADLLVFDLDPGAPATIVECCRVAALLRAELEADGLSAYPKTSGRKGMQLYAPIAGATTGATSEYAKRLAVRLEERHPRLVLSRMAKNLRRGKVFVDWSQNNAAKTTVAPYSLRAARLPTVSTPVTWDEIAHCDEEEQLRFTAEDVLERVAEHGDLFADLTTEDTRAPLPE
ncbi:MAG: ATP-dependent DNA ligase [Streptosporangiales bacterium]|nr:ATP-dependent DNA ligase [Streptosporangiales bacterium]